MFQAARNRGLDGNQDPILFETRTVLDVEGNTLVVIDARNNTAEETLYAASGLKLKTDSQDAGRPGPSSARVGQPRQHPPLHLRRSQPPDARLSQT